MYEGRLGHCCREVCQVAARHGVGVRGGPGAVCAVCSPVLYGGACAKMV